MTTPILDRCIQCPKCQTKTMRKAHGNNTGGEYFSDCCHNYFSISELVHFWDYDLGDFGDTTSVKETLHIAKLKGYTQHYDVRIDYSPQGFGMLIKPIDTVSNLDEPEWYSILERDEAYEMVNRMFLDISELETIPNIGKALTWDDLADIYNKATGRHARTYRMETIFDWAKNQTDKFFVDETGSIHEILLDGTTNDGIDTGLYR